MRLVEATDAQRRARDEVTFAAWGQGLSLPQFRERELRLRAHPWAAQALTTWLWCGDDGAVLASCETFAGPARVGAQRGVAETVASVFVEPALRGRGLASAMLREVAERLRSRGRLAAVLFSEVGPRLYEALGYRAVRAFDVLLDAAPREPAGVEWLSAPLPAPEAPEADDASLVLELSAPRLDWQLERERCYAKALGQPPLRAYGARVGDACATWTAYWKTRELQVLSLAGGTAAARATLLGAAASVAHEAGLPLVRHWETTPLDLAAGWRRVPRTDEVPMFLPLAAAARGWVAVERGLWA